MSVFRKIIGWQSRRDLLAWLIFILLLSCSLYRSYVATPLSLDAYLLYLPGITFFVPLACLLACSTRNRTSYLRLLFSSALVFGWLWPLRLSSAKTPSHVYRLVSLNLQSHTTDVSRAIADIREYEPDFVCLQEVWNRTELEKVVNLLPQYRVFGGAEDDHKRRTFNDGTFIAVQKRWSVEETSLKEESALVKVSRSQKALIIVSVHAPRAASFSPAGLKQTVQEQTDKSKELRDELESFKDPVLVAGDFNAPESGPAFKILGSRFHGAFREAGGGFGLTFPANFPVARIDHVLGTEQVRFTRYRTFDFGSDHLGQVVDFRTQP